MYKVDSYMQRSMMHEGVKHFENLLDISRHKDGKLLFYTFQQNYESAGLGFGLKGSVQAGKPEGKKFKTLNDM